MSDQKCRNTAQGHRTAGTSCTDLSLSINIRLVSVWHTVIPLCGLATAFSCWWPVASHKLDSGDEVPSRLSE